MSRPALTSAHRPDKRSPRRGAVSPWMALAVLALLALAAPLLLAACGAEETPPASGGTPAATTTATRGDRDPGGEPVSA